MIISASYKTDIPTFYGEWFMNRLRAGSCKMVNPYSRKAIDVSLRREDVDGIVFWTKNAAPFLKHLPEVRARGFPFVLQHTINGYPRALEQAVVNADKAVDSVASICDLFGPRVVVWRYDTIVFSSLTPHAFHAENFAKLARSLRGLTNEVVVSFAHVYAKTKRNMDAALRAEGVEWHDPSAAEKRALLVDLLKIARAERMVLSVCSQPDLMVDGTVEARCVDARRITEIAGQSFESRLKGNRKECGCFEARDIGDYDTCPHGCVYCYAVQNRALALGRFRVHDPTSEFLFHTESAADEPDQPDPHAKHRQLKLF